MTETYRAGADGRDKLEKLLRTLYSLLQDLTFLNSTRRNWSATPTSRLN